MAKYNKSQVKFILEKLRGEMVSGWSLTEQLYKRYQPKKPASVTKYEADVKAAREKANKEANTISAKQKEYIASIESSLMLADVDFDLEKAIREIKALG